MKHAGNLFSLPDYALSSRAELEGAAMTLVLNPNYYILRNPPANIQEFAQYLNEVIDELKKQDEIMCLKGFDITKIPIGPSKPGH